MFFSSLNIRQPNLLAILSIVLTETLAFMKKYGFDGGEKYVKGEVFDQIIDQRTQ